MRQSRELNTEKYPWRPGIGDRTDDTIGTMERNVSRYHRHFDRFAQRFQGGKLYKNSVNGIIFGVCAGVAEWLGVKALAVRIAAVLGLIFLSGPTIIAYFVAALVLSNRPTARYDRYARAFGEDYGSWRR